VETRGLVGDLGASCARYRASAPYRPVRVGMVQRVNSPSLLPERGIVKEVGVSGLRSAGRSVPLPA